MIRTQIQIPDDVYRRAKQVAEAREISLAELLRRGLDYMLSVYASSDTPESWQPPSPRRLGWMGLSPEELKYEAQRGAAQEALEQLP